MVPNASRFSHVRLRALMLLVRQCWCSSSSKKNPAKHGTSNKCTMRCPGGGRIVKCGGNCVDVSHPICAMLIRRTCIPSWFKTTNTCFAHMILRSVSVPLGRYFEFQARSCWVLHGRKLQSTRTVGPRMLHEQPPACVHGKQGTNHLDG